MAKLGEISGKIDKRAKKKKESPESLSESFLKEGHPELPLQETLEYIKEFQKEYIRLKKAIFDSQSAFRDIPLFSAFLEWMEKAYSQNQEEIEQAKLLWKFINWKASDGSTWTIHDASLSDPNKMYENIRCQREWSLSLREKLVNAYKQFIIYLSFRTSSYVKYGFELDLEKKLIMNRVVKLEEFALYADHLKDKIQLIAKLLYYGGDKTLEEILELTIPSINSEKHQITFGTQVVSYPRHVFVDINAIIGKRTKGKLFLGRQNAPLNSTTVFRNFKEAGIKSGMGAHFSPAYLTKNK